MKVFLSWSGERSKMMAEALKTWLPDVIQAVEPWVSSQDIKKGSRGLAQVADELAESDFGIICVTSDNQHSQWVNFEAGALSKQISESLVVPVLLDVPVVDLTGPLAQFQAAESRSRDDFRKLMHDLNAALDGAGIAPERLDRSFDRYWPDLHRNLTALRERAGSPARASRTTPDMLSEVLVLMRQQERRLVDLEGMLRLGRGSAEERDLAPVPFTRARRTGAGLDGMVLAELQQVAAGLGIRGTARMRKSQLIEVIREHQTPPRHQ